ncbi:MAG: hypothetical protein HOJ49_05905 [Nitrospina sp.]|nr:hypothetical protein [Nitrospina sp.]
MTLISMEKRIGGSTLTTLENWNVLSWTGIMMENLTWCVYQNKCINSEHHSRWHQGLCGFVYKQFLNLIDAKSDQIKPIKDVRNFS